MLRAATRQLRAAGSSSPRLDAELLLAHVLGSSRENLLAHPERGVADSALTGFQALVSRRAASEPMAYLLGEREFYGRVFKVDRRALIPRPETELLVEIGIAAVARGLSQVVEVGTGSGAVAISLAAETGRSVVATDVSFDALRLAHENACALGQAQQVRLVQTNLLAGLHGLFDVILGNLPYIPRGRRLPPDVADYEPAVALYAGPRGTELLEQLLHQARPLLAPGGEIALELDEAGQAQPVAELAGGLYPEAQVGVRQDAGGYERAVWVRTQPAAA